MQALHRCHGNAKGRTPGIKQPAACITFHHCYTHVSFVAKFVQCSALHIDAAKLRVIFISKELHDVIRRRKHVKSRIDGEKDHFHRSFFHGHPCNFCVVCTKTNVVNLSGFLQFLHVSHKGAVQDTFPVCNLIHIVDHANVDIIRFET